MVSGKQKTTSSELDRQTALDLIQWLKINRSDLHQQAENRLAGSEKNPGHQNTPKNRTILRSLLDLLWVHPDSLHGHYRVTPELKTSAKVTATVMTTSNWIDIVGNFPIYLFAFKSLTWVPSLGISLILSVCVLIASNAVSQAVAHGHKGRWKVAITALIFGLIPLNMLQTVATGIGMEVLNNREELAQIAASGIIDDILQTQEETLHRQKQAIPNDVKLCAQERQALEAMPRNTSVQEKAFHSRYVRIYGTFASKQRPTNLPLEQLPLCVRANRLEMQHNQEVGTLVDQLNSLTLKRAKTGNDLLLLKEISPNTYTKTFVEVNPLIGQPSTELRSGVELVTLGTQSFFDKLTQGEWEKLGINLFFLGLSTITSVVSVGMGVTFALSADARKSYDPVEREKVNQFFKRMRIALSEIHREQREELEKRLQKQSQESNSQGEVADEDFD